MGKIRKDVQIAILKYLEQKYPRFDDFGSIYDNVRLQFSANNELHIFENAIYLHQHGLIVGEAFRHDPVGLSLPDLMVISKEGLDYLSADGGLSAELGIVTVKIHDETIFRLESFIRQADLSSSQKNEFAHRLRELPADAIKHMVLKLLDLGLANSSSALQLIQKCLGLN